MEQEQLQEWVGKTEQRIERIAPFPANALAATLDRDDPVYSNETALPPLWHWLHFLPVFKLCDAGYDGHAALGGFLPPVPLPRRMWAGSRLNFHAPMQIGQELKKVSTIKSVKAKTGRSGQLVFVTVGHQVFDGGTLGVDEEHDIVYREEPSADAPAPVPPQAPDIWEFSRDIDPDPVLLFRYSALTFNGHRIHYDQPFCVNSEGYNGLVVHGPLLATLLLDLLRREKPDATVKSFEFRAISTIFDYETFSVHGAAEEDGKTFRLWARRQDGALAMNAKAMIA
ncbi:MULTISPECIES: MaoC family dehydratase N-terminal domain-containing protein [unclassified Ruegeria]|uniref:FAS1-like dehydratase domain-containing protein n=1 Tax=unclassified Ruegeria TaxID=2625375 RepID=UPI00149219FA|nr:MULTISPECIES: MaoC family dehydratase N-terminal domain-containing protein [unclassified Ruegeria]NOD85583.1 acyl-CoA dehydrogenase [Ruegeria sp. HKCCD6119]